MKVALEFSGERADIILEADGEAEKSILSFLAQSGKQWLATPSFGSRVGGVDKIRLEESPMKLDR